MALVCVLVVVGGDCWGLFCRSLWTRSTSRISKPFYRHFFFSGIELYSIATIRHIPTSFIHLKYLAIPGSLNRYILLASRNWRITNHSFHVTEKTPPWKTFMILSTARLSSVAILFQVTSASPTDGITDAIINVRGVAAPTSRVNATSGPG